MAGLHSPAALDRVRIVGLPSHHGRGGGQPLHHIYPLSTDLRGTVMADTTGVARIATPFGLRDIHPSMAAALDYVEKGYDADLGFVRMGVRDYDPMINRFVTPDPLYLRNPAKCLQRPQSCNLYTYAGGAPTAFTDPTGEDIWDVGRGAGDAVRSNLILGLGREKNGNWDFRLGQSIGDGISTVVGAAEFLYGLTIGGGGVAVSTTGVGAVIGVPAAVHGAVAATHGESVVLTGLHNLFTKSPGSRGGGGDSAPEYNADNFRENLAKTAKYDTKGFDAHHIFPQEFRDRFRKLLDINVDDPRWGSWWESGSHLDNAQKYNRGWDKFFAKYNEYNRPTLEQAKTFARDLMQSYGQTTPF